MAPIMDKLQNAIKAVGAEGGFVFIYDSTSMLYNGNGVQDVSPLVKAKLGIK
jgi:outer membrane protein